MDRYQSRRECAVKGRQAQVLDMIVDYRFLAPATMARNEERDRWLAEAALNCDLPVTPPESERRPLLAVVRCSLGECLIRFGATLCGTRVLPPPVLPTMGTASGSGQ
jgi:hypothetical protein